MHSDQPFRPRFLSCEQLAQLQTAEEAPVAIDVREHEEWNAGHMDGAVHVPLAYIDADADWAIPHFGYPVVLYCAGGSRAERAAEELEAIGYYNVYVLEDGYRGWCGQRKTL